MRFFRNNSKNKNIILVQVFTLCFLLYKNSQADEIGLYKTGLSYHIGADDDNPAYRDAPLGLDKNGAFVYNPGIGVIIDMINVGIESHEVSLVPLIMHFRDCDTRGVWVLGAGPRYRFFFIKEFSFDTELYLSSYIAQTWEDAKYHGSFMPFYSVGFSYHWEKICFGIKTTLSPKNTASSSTGGFWILFTNLYIGFKF